MKTLVILSHPNLAASRVNKALSQVAKSAADVEVRHLEGLYGLDIAQSKTRWRVPSASYFCTRCTG